MMCEFHDSNGNGLGDIWWTDKSSYYRSHDISIHMLYIVCLHINVDCKSMEKWEDMLWRVVRQEDASVKTEGKGLQNCGQTSSVVRCREQQENKKHD